MLLFTTIIAIAIVNCKTEYLVVKIDDVEEKGKYRFFIILLFIIYYFNSIASLLRYFKIALNWYIFSKQKYIKPHNGSIGRIKRYQNTQERFWR